MKKVSANEAFGMFKPESCVFVVSADKKGRPNGMVASWNMKCSEEPPMLAVALWNRGNTHRLIRQSKEFVIAVPNMGLLKEVEYFGSHHGNKTDKFRETGIKTMKARYVRPPLIRDATVNFECRLEKDIGAGECIIFVGKVLASYINPGKKIILNLGSENGKRLFREL